MQPLKRFGLVALLASGVAAQVVTPRGRVAAIYRDPQVESGIVGEVEANGRWRLDFTGAEAAARIPAAFPLRVTFLLPGRDSGVLMARVRGRGRRDEGWIEPNKVEVSPDAAWKIPADTRVFVPMRAGQIPPARVVPQAVEPGMKEATCLVLLDPEGKVAGVRPLEPATCEAEALVRQFRFAPVRVEGEPVHVLLAIRLKPK